MTLDQPLDRPLDRFEQSLLTELREHVATRTPVRTRSRRWRWAALPAGAALAIGAGVIALQPSPASAYTVADSGNDVVVTIKRLDDASGLERALRAHGIDADVDYSGKTPPPPPDAVTSKTEPGSHQESSSIDSGPTTSSSGQDGSGSGPVRADIQSSMSKDGFTLRIDPDTLPADAVLHITTSGSIDEGVSGLRVMIVQER